MPAKPSTISMSSSSSRETLSFTQSMSECTRKRKRQDDSDDDSQDFDPSSSRIHDDSNKTRRINPFKLAGRLHPDLVKEMETFIKPGAIMPNFEIRKELQERYQVDRRHLYDYFHSRGLRVAKEDRHSNLARSRLAKAKAQAQAQGTKENVSQKPSKPAKYPKLPPARRTTTKTAKRTVKIASNIVHPTSSSEPDTPAYRQESSVDSIPDDDHKPHFESFEYEIRQSAPCPDVFLNCVNTIIDVANPVEEEPFFNDNSSFACSTPSLTGSSVPSSPSSGSMLADDEAFCPSDFVSEFLNLPDPQSDFYAFMDPVADLSPAPSMIGDLMSSDDRKNMYGHIDSKIVSDGSSFALDFTTQTLDSKVLPTPTPGEILSSSYDANALFDFNYDTLARGTNNVSPLISNAALEAKSLLRSLASYFLHDFSQPTPTFSGVPPSALSNISRAVRSAGDFSTLGLDTSAQPVESIQAPTVPGPYAGRKHVHGFPVTIEEGAFDHAKPYFSVPPSRLRTVSSGGGI